MAFGAVTVGDPSQGAHALSPALLCLRHVTGHRSPWKTPNISAVLYTASERTLTREIRAKGNQKALRNAEGSAGARVGARSRPVSTGPGLVSQAGGGHGPPPPDSLELLLRGCSPRPTGISNTDAGTTVPPQPHPY